MADAKPADFFLGVMEFFAVVLPGAAFVYLIQPWTVDLVPMQLRPTDSTDRWAVFLMLAYIVGHLLYAFSSYLDRVYDQYYLRKTQPDHYLTVKLLREGVDIRSLQSCSRLSSTLVARAYLQSGPDSSGTSLYDWCLSLAHLRETAAVAEIERTQADSKFFRSLTFVLLAGAIITLFKGFVVASGGALLLSIFSGWRFCALRWEATKRVYEYFLLHHRYPPACVDRPSGAS